MSMIRVLVCSMIVGLSPTHADDNGHPFGIQPRQQTVWVNTLAETRSWKRQFLSLADFIKVIQQPYFRVLTSGESPTSITSSFAPTPTSSCSPMRSGRMRNPMAISNCTAGPKTGATR